MVMPHINEQAFRYLIDDQHTSGELSSFSFRKGRESKGTIIANIFRGNQQRCLELTEECEKIFHDTERLKTLKFIEIQNLMRNAGNLKDELEGTRDYERADRVFQNLLAEYRKRPEYHGNI